DYNHHRHHYYHRHLDCVQSHVAKLLLHYDRCIPMSKSLETLPCQSPFWSNGNVFPTCSVEINSRRRSIHAQRIAIANPAVLIVNSNSQINNPINPLLKMTLYTVLFLLPSRFEQLLAV
ncbi:MAG: hypothetical protein PHX79_03855, partial [Sphaerochaetaceae bacterium]|nr:hypothetical protein [Sphaerochaetaceae bacterium]